MFIFLFFNLKKINAIKLKVSLVTNPHVVAKFQTHWIRQLAETIRQNYKKEKIIKSRLLNHCSPPVANARPQAALTTKTNIYNLEQQNWDVIIWFALLANHGIKV